MECSKLKAQISVLESADYERAGQLQAELAKKIILEDDFLPVTKVAGLDVGFEKGNSVAIGGIVILAYPGLRVIEKCVSRRDVIFPYVPGFLSFREVPVLLDAYQKVRNTPDLLICDGQGIAHPRRFGLACHLGIMLDIPAIGAGKSRLIGHYCEPAPAKGSYSALTDRQEIIGGVVRSRRGCKPLFVSPGHKICITSAIRWTLNCCPKYRIPETTRQAHNLVSGA